MRTYLTVYLGSTILAIITTSLVIYIAKRFEIFDLPEIRKVHKKPIPRIGGAAIFISMIGMVIPVLLLENNIGQTFRVLQSKIITLLGAGFFMFTVGLVDDIKGLRVRTKFLAQFIAALMVCAAGIRITSIPITTSLTIHFGWFSWILTIFCITGITNAINLSDGLDGLAAGISAIACGVIAILAIYNGDIIMAILMLALLGSLTGFMLFNFEPAKVFMGDSGSLFLGFTIASASVLSATKTETIVGLALPILALGIPIFDTLFSMLRRFLERRSLFSPDRSHFHHRLLALGLRQRHVVLTAYIVSMLAAGLGMFMLVTRNSQTIVIFICTLILLVLVFRVVGSVRLRETIAGLKRKYTITSRQRKELETFEKIELHFRQAKQFDEWWQAVCFAANEMSFVSSSLLITNRDGTKQTLMRQQNNGHVQGDKILRMIVPVRDRRANSSLFIDIHVHTNGSLESAGRRVALFTRLIDEHCLAALANKQTTLDKMNQKKDNPAHPVNLVQIKDRNGKM